MIIGILLALIYVQNSITMPHLAVIQLMRVIKWPRSDYDSSCVNKNVRVNKGFYSNQDWFLLYNLCFIWLITMQKKCEVFSYYKFSNCGSPSV